MVRSSSEILNPKRIGRWVKLRKVAPSTWVMCPYLGLVYFKCTLKRYQKSNRLLTVIHTQGL
jgi:hypothetical protein